MSKFEKLNRLFELFLMWSKSDNNFGVSFCEFIVSRSNINGFIIPEDMPMKDDTTLALIMFISQIDNGEM